MHFAKDVYVSESLNDKNNKKAKILRDIKYGRTYTNYYLVYESDNKLECMKSFYFKQKFFACKAVTIIAVLDSYSDAIEYMARKTAQFMGVIYDD